MTETNKIRVVKYLAIISKMPESMLLESFNNSDWMKDRAISCAIAEVEAVIEVERKYANFGEIALLTDDLPELKSMLQ